jgi:hypothetical protein
MLFVVFLRLGMQELKEIQHIVQKIYFAPT